MQLLVLLIAITMLSACTARNAYEFIRGNERSRCNRLPDTERERCLSRNAADFDSFERQRATAQEPTCPEFSEKIREVCIHQVMEDLVSVERQRVDAKQRPSP